MSIKLTACFVSFIILLIASLSVTVPWAARQNDTFANLMGIFPLIAAAILVMFILVSERGDWVSTIITRLGTKAAQRLKSLLPKKN